MRYLKDNLERRIEALNDMEQALKGPMARDFFETVYAPPREEDEVWLEQVKLYLRRADGIPPNERLMEMTRLFYAVKEQRVV